MNSKLIYKAWLIDDGVYHKAGTVKRRCFPDCFISSWALKCSLNRMYDEIPSYEVHMFKLLRIEEGDIS